MVPGLALAAQAAAQGQQAGQPAAQEKKKQVKDQGEYDLFNGVIKATDPNTKLKLIEQWKQKYPNSDFKDDRNVYAIQPYAQLGKYADAIASAKAVLAPGANVTPDQKITAMYWISTLTPAAYPANPPEDALDTADKAANGLLNAEKPPETKPEAWTAAKKDLDALAHKTLGWVAWQRKNYDVAEQEFVKTLQLKPDQAEASWWYGNVLIATKKPEKQAQGLYEFARAVEVPLSPAQGGLSEQLKKQIDAYLTKTYTSYHGSAEGLDQMKQLAKAQALPPADFAIKSGAVIAAEKEEEFKKTNPQLALWMSVKKELAGPNGEQYFESSMKGAELPKLKGKIVQAKPAVRSKELLVAIEDSSTPEVTLKLDAPLTGKPKIGSEVEFQGIPTAFSKDPFMVTVDTEKSKITGLEMEAPARPARPGARKGARKRG